MANKKTVQHPKIERFKIVETNPLLPILDVTFDGDSISIATLVNLANQLVSALNDRGCSFEVIKNDSEQL